MPRNKIIPKKIIFEKDHVKVFYLKGTGENSMGNFYKEFDNGAFFSLLQSDVEQYLRDNNKEG